jgi:hypothetical protein
MLIFFSKTNKKEMTISEQFAFRRKYVQRTDTFGICIFCDFSECKDLLMTEDSDGRLAVSWCSCETFRHSVILFVKPIAQSRSLRGYEGHRHSWVGAMNNGTQIIALALLGG